MQQFKDRKTQELNTYRYENREGAGKERDRSRSALVFSGTRGGEVK